MQFLDRTPSIAQVLLGQLQLAIASIPSNCSDRILTLPEIPLNRFRDDTQVVYRSAIALKLSSIYQLPALDLAHRVVNYLPASPKFTVRAIEPGWIDFRLSDRGLANWLQHLIQPSSRLRLPSPCSPLLAGEGLGVRSRGVEGKQAFGKGISYEKPNSKPPVNLFPVQYAHARCCSVLRLGHSQGLIEIETDANESAYMLLEPNPIPWLNPEGKLYLVHLAERKLIDRLLWVTDELHSDREPNWRQIAIALSQALLNFHTSCQIWGEVKTQTPQLSQVRLGLVGITRSSLKSLLEDIFQAPAPVEL
jgi:arginyl-tRNA synthetase